METNQGLWQRLAANLGFKSASPSKDQREDSSVKVASSSSNGGVVMVDPAVAVTAEVCCGKCGGGGH